MRYVVALIVALVVIGAGAIFVQTTTQGLRGRMLPSLEAARARGTISEEQYRDALAQESVKGFGIELPPREIVRLKVADYLSGFWFVLAPLAIALCLAVAHLTRRSQQNSEDRRR